MSELLDVTLRSIVISGSATLLSFSISLPLAYWLARPESRFRALVEVFESLVGVPTVLIGLLVYMLLSNKGPLGSLGLLYTPYAIIIGESLLVLPLLVAYLHRIMAWILSNLGELLLTYGAAKSRIISLVLREAFPGTTAALVMGFSRAVGELGVALLVGGNIRWYTRTLSTAIALEVSKGSYEVAIQLGLILVATMLTTGILATLLRRRWGD